MWVIVSAHDSTNTKTLGKMASMGESQGTSAWWPEQTRKSLFHSPKTFGEWFCGLMSQKKNFGGDTLTQPFKIQKPYQQSSRRWQRGGLGLPCCCRNRTNRPHRLNLEFCTENAEGHSPSINLWAKAEWSWILQQDNDLKQTTMLTWIRLRCCCRTLKWPLMFQTAPRMAEWKQFCKSLQRRIRLKLPQMFHCCYSC